MPRVDFTVGSTVDFTIKLDCRLYSKLYNRRLWNLLRLGAPVSQCPVPPVQEWGLWGSFAGLREAMAEPSALYRLLCKLRHRQAHCTVDCAGYGHNQAHCIVYCAGYGRARRTALTIVLYILLRITGDSPVGCTVNSTVPRCPSESVPSAPQCGSGGFGRPVGSCAGLW